MLFFGVLRCRQLLLLEEQRCAATGSCSHGKNIDLKIKKEKKSRCKFQGFCCCCFGGWGDGGGDDRVGGGGGGV